MKMDIVAGSKNDEFYTPVYAIVPIVEYAKRFNKVWLPFDTAESNYVKVFKENGIPVVCTHISDGTDFFNCEVPEGVDCIISNPPYSLKNEVFERLFKLDLPFAMLLGCLKAKKDLTCLKITNLKLCISINVWLILKIMTTQNRR